MPKWNDGRFMDNEVDGKKVLTGVFWKFSERIVAKVVELVISLILARVLAPNDYGLVAMVLVFISLADVFVTSGFSTSLIQKKDANEVDYSTMFFCSFFCSCIIYFIIYMLAPTIAKFYNEDDLCLIIRVFAFRIPISAYNSIQHAYVSRNMLFKLFFWSTLSGTIISGIMGVAMAYMGFGVWSLIAQYFVNTIVDTIVLACTLKWHVKFIFSLKSAKSLMKYGWKILLADLSGTFFGQLRNLIIGKVYTKTDLAFYNKGQQFPELIYTNLSSSIMSVLFPAMSNFSNDIDKVRYITQKSMQALVYTVVPIMLGMAAVAKPLIRIILTNKWLGAVPYLQILCIDYSIATMGVAQFQALKAIGSSDVVLKLEIIKKPVFVLLLIIGVKIDVLAVAITMTIYELYGVIVNCMQAQKYIGYKIKNQFLDNIWYIVIALVMTVVVYVIEIGQNDIVNLIVKILTGILTYLGLSKLFHIDMLQKIIHMIRKIGKEKINGSDSFFKK